jgi:hypothetical protein
MRLRFPGSIVSPLAALCALAATAAHAQAPSCDFDPQVSELVLNTDFAEVPTANCGTVTVAGGVFLFRSVRIGPGVIVRGAGSNPMIWIVTGDFVVDGELTVRGGDGAAAATHGVPMFPSPGGAGACGGGDGGMGSQNTTRRTFAAQAGFGPGQVAGLGGVGGQLG